MFRRVCLGILPFFLALSSAVPAAGTAWNEGARPSPALEAAAQGKEPAPARPAGLADAPPGAKARQAEAAEAAAPSEAATSPGRRERVGSGAPAVPAEAAPAGRRQAGQNAAPGSVPSGIRLFGTVEFRGALKNMPKWQRVLAEESRSPSFERDLDKVMRPAVFAQWKELAHRAKTAPAMEKLRAVNTFFNRWPYRTDREVYKLEDYWATPYEFIKNSGDCEDYAMAKFFALKKLGVPVESMRIVALMDKIRNIGHAVLVVYVDGTAYVLDNLTDMVLSHERFTHYMPQYSVNEEYRWAHVMPKKKQ